MIEVLANDGLDESAVTALLHKGIRVHTQKIPADQLPDAINNYDALIVRSATQVREPLIRHMKRTRLIIRAGVGVDNIDVEAAEQQGIAVKNTPRASSASVAELVFAHLFSLVRYLYDANRHMPDRGHTHFTELKKKYANGRELRGKTLGLLGFGNIGQECARIALGLGMKVVAYDPFVASADLHIPIGDTTVPVRMLTVSKNEVLREADFISIHASGGDEVLTADDFSLMKDGVGIVNCARGGVVRESVLLEQLRIGKVAYAALDVFEQEPAPDEQVLRHPRLSLTPHIGASTLEAQQRIGREIVDLLCSFFKR
ncbi:MAG: D-2-hydroxyacid dehydrogenase [Chitinophagales bacterium]|nr:D-2-hydroxyacid dehydrogenase [Chitinophagales bacterium]MDW8393628.1 D-2-hydroxyacid dehydrogenase [Chitinophagales bacterium]